MGAQRVLWTNRSDAGTRLAERLADWRGHPNAWVMGLPRGGVIVAAEIATRLQLPLHSWAVRKLAHPSHPELALGAVAPGGVRIWDQAFDQLDPELRQRLVTEQEWELKRRQQLYGDPPIAMLQDRALIVVDDGVATGWTVRAALQSLRAALPSQLLLAVPVIDQHVAQQLQPQVDALVALASVDGLWAVGAWYQHFDPVPDPQVIAILAASQSHHDR